MPGPVLDTMFTEVEDPISAFMQEAHPRASEMDGTVEHMVQGKHRGASSSGHGSQAGREWGGGGLRINELSSEGSKNLMYSLIFHSCKVLQQVKVSRYR